MQKRVLVMLFLGFVMGLGLASCATQETDREPAAAGVHRADGRPCYKGERRNAEGYCTRIQDVARPARKGGNL